MDNQINTIQIKENLSKKNYKIDNIEEKIYTIRGKQVMLDSDVATLYNYETRRINETVKRNIRRFPDFTE